MPRDLSGGDEQQPEIILSRDQVGRSFEIVTAGAFAADEVTPEGSFPEYGEFLSCANSQGEAVFLELPQDLERQLVEKGEDVQPGALEGLVFRVAGCRKTRDGNWTYDLEWFDDWAKASTV